eukprot:4703729-Pyramimonas_sp.AAC.1
MLQNPMENCSYCSMGRFCETGRDSSSDLEHRHIHCHRDGPSPQTCRRHEVPTPLLPGAALRVAPSTRHEQFLRASNPVRQKAARSINESRQATPTFWNHGQ